MKETIRQYAGFTLAILCALFSIGMKFLAQALLYAGNVCLHRAERSIDFALRISGVTEAGIED
jgi:hypothetical protein